MIITFQILLLSIIFISFISMFEDYNNNQRNKTLAFVCVGAMIVFCISIMFF